MDRRTFLSGTGAVGISGALTAALSVRESSSAKARAEGLRQGAGELDKSHPAPEASRVNKVAPVPNALTLGYLPGSAGMFASPRNESLMPAIAAGLSWAQWDASLARQMGQSAFGSLFKFSASVDLSIGQLHRADQASAGTFTALEIVAHFAIDDAPYVVPFNAWSYTASQRGGLVKSTQPLTFTASVPDFVALSVNYAMDPSLVANGINTTGQLYLPVGGGASSTAGLANGLYVLASPSTHTGMFPDMSAYRFSGDVRSPLADPSGRPLDFDYLTLAIRPIAI